MTARMIGQYIVIDPEICDGEPTFRDTNIRIKDVLDAVARGVPWDTIVAHYQTGISRQAVAEAVCLAGEVLAKHGRVPPKRVRDAPPTLLGDYVVADPAICHGAVTFGGTRIFVEDVLGDVADEEPWERIIENWHNSISRDAIAEAVRLAGESLSNHAGDLILEFTPA